MKISRAETSKKYNAWYIKIEKKKCSIILDTLDFLFKILISRHPEVFYKKGVLESFAKFTRKHLSQNLFF